MHRLIRVTWRDQVTLRADIELRLTLRKRKSIVHQGYSGPSQKRYLYLCKRITLIHVSPKVQVALQIEEFFHRLFI